LLEQLGFPGTATSYHKSNFVVTDSGLFDSQNVFRGPENVLVSAHDHFSRYLPNRLKKISRMSLNPLLHITTDNRLSDRFLIHCLCSKNNCSFALALIPLIQASNSFLRAASMGSSPTLFGLPDVTMRATSGRYTAKTGMADEKRRAK